MSIFLIAVTYLFLLSLIAMLISILTSSRKRLDENLETSDALLGPDDIEKHASELARTHLTGKASSMNASLINRVRRNFKFISETHTKLSADAESSFSVPPAAEWLLDNYYIIEEQVKEIENSLPRSIRKNLPVLRNGRMRGYLRIYTLAVEMVSHNDGMIDEKTIIRFINAYQTHSTLTLGELWAVPVMLRIALIGNIRSVCQDLMDTSIHWHNAEEDAEKLIKYLESNNGDLIKAISEIIKKERLLSCSYVEHIVQRLRKNGKKTAAFIHYIDARLAEQGSSLEACSSFQHQLMASKQVNMGNLITSLKSVSSMDWTELFESLSQVEKILKKDPSGIYPKMEFESRDYYRHIIERLAREKRVSEILVAQKAVVCAQESNGKLSGRISLDHIGYYLVGKGKNELDKKIGSAGRRCTFFRFDASLLYTGSIIFAAILFSLCFSIYAFIKGRSFAAAILGFIISLIPSFEISMTVINFLLCRIHDPSLLPKLELKDGIPPDISTMIIVPTLLTNVNRVAELIRQLEVYYLANKETNLYFALVGDFKDSGNCEEIGDNEIISCAMDGVRELNTKYDTGKGDIFFFFHRSRQYNSAERKWMGWERKRGAIMELNELLRGSTQTSFTYTSCDQSRLPRVKYVITLDADTILPIGSVKRLIGTIAHPMNRAVVDPEKGIVTDGYGVLQPRIGVSVISSNASGFARIFAGQGGIDPYTTAVSDVYQDIFGEGIFTGKGIYDLDVFRQVLKDSIPENSVLSHDLLEGCYARAGLVTDIELVDGYPSKYASYAMRQHRWVRGDWQLIPWLLKRVRDRNGNKKDNPIGYISKWKIFDNLRRSLNSTGTVILTIAGLTLLPGNSLVWLVYAALSVGIHFILDTAGYFFSGNGLPIPGRKQGISAGSFIRTGFYRFVMQVAFLPHQTFLMLDAILRTLIRLTFTRRNMLEWVTAADMEKRLKNDRTSSWIRMWFSPLIGLAVAIIAYLSKQGWYVSIPFVLAWVAAPELAYISGRKTMKKLPRPSNSDMRLLRRTARKTWRYFEEMLTPRDHYLPPDNYQEDPPNGIAHRTSPSNIGLALISILSARDLGFICYSEMLRRLEFTMASVEKLEKWQGHLLNWYNTTNLSILRPAYVSTVDSGNYIGCLMVLRTALKELPEKKIFDMGLALGLRDTIELFNENAANTGIHIDTGMLDSYLAAGIEDIDKWYQVLNDLWKEISLDEVKLKKIKKNVWGIPVINMINSLMNELNLFMPAAAYFAESDLNFTGIGIVCEKLRKSASFAELLNTYDSIVNLIKEGEQTDPGGINAELFIVSDEHVLKRIQTAAEGLREFISRIDILTEKLSSIINEISFKPLYDPKRQLFSIGFNVDEGMLSKSYYDLLASEARQASYIAVARGEVGSKHWFRLGRRMTVADKRRGLVSWTGTMFEYFMPLLLMKNYENTLLDETYKFALYIQKKYGATRGIPWGTSESAFFAFDRNMNYQYKAFGVPELGLKRGLGSEMVVAPYASILTVTLDPAGTAKNLRKLMQEGMDGIYGFYEAIDYTPSRILPDRHSGIVKNYMVHHMGMSLVALNNFFNSNIMQERFHSDPVIRCAELFLQERMPQRMLVTSGKTGKYTPFKLKVQDDGKVIRKFGIPDSELPRLHVLSNGSYSVLLTSGGSGVSYKNELAITRWKGDQRDNRSGFYIFIQNINSNECWSATYDPLGNSPDNYRVVFAPDRAEFTRKDGNIETRTHIAVSTEDNAEIRRVSLTNYSSHTRTLELTSYLEVVLATERTDRAHPAFSKLFVTTEYVPEYECLLAYRRPREKDKKPVWAVHSVHVDGEIAGNIQYETDRLKFIGRNNNLGKPRAMQADQPLSNSAGSVLDPIMSLRRRINVYPGQTVHLSFMLGFAESREDAIKIAEKYRDAKTHERAFELARTRSLLESSYLNLKAREVELYLDMLPSIVYSSAIRRKWLKETSSAVYGQESLWAYGISGDMPVILLTISEREEMDTLFLMLKAHEFWKMKGINVDMVILVDDESGYMQPLFDTVRDAVSNSYSRDSYGKPGGVYVINSTQLQPEELSLLETAAKLLIKGSAGPINEQISIETKAFSQTGRIARMNTSSAKAAECKCFDASGLLFFNGIGGFLPDGSEYVILLREDMRTPMPWVNIITNGKFGFQVSEIGSGHTWCDNSRENKLTPWSNDPVTDPPGEVLYIRDDDDGSYWTVAPCAVREAEEYIVRHGFGYTRFEHDSHGISQELVEFVPLNEPVKLCMLSISNNRDVPAKLSLIYYCRPVLGVDESITSQYICTSVDQETGMLTAVNVFGSCFPGKVMFVDSSEDFESYTANRTDFIGINGSLENPAAMVSDKLSGITGPGLDPCIAVQIKVEMHPGEKKEIVFMLGESSSNSEAREISRKYKNIGQVKSELDAVTDFWKEKLGRLKVKTPDNSLDIMLNGWLLYQVIACRLWSRSGFYQAGGAYGFRDQLQDVLALNAIWPQLTRSQIILHAEKQFVEGDVQHWWHPEEGKGIRTRYSDDLLWLPYVTAEYIRHTGDISVLSEEIAFLESEPLKEEEHERYETPKKSDEVQNLYMHCIRAIDKAIHMGPHGLPLIGSGDWNDGMNTVGIEGKGESIWLGWFVISVLDRFIPICRDRGDIDKALIYETTRNSIIQAIEENGWDGSWYRRAYFDDGTPLGSALNTECRIDSIAQSWSVISQAGKLSRATEAMDAVKNYLIDREENIIKLLAPPFNESDLSPGYIKGYVPGVRENGGQYTHAAVWVVLAFAMLGKGSEAADLFHKLNPVNHSRTAIEAARYKVEPYVMAADVYTVHPNIGRGGWTWYTGAASWMYSVGIEYILGIKKLNGYLIIDPCIPAEWEGFSANYRLEETMYRINVSNRQRVQKGVIQVKADGAVIEGNAVKIENDRKDHFIEVTMGFTAT